MSPSPRPRVALFVTCLVDAMRPRVGFAALAALEDAGCEVVVPRSQTCCGQPALNSGDREGAAAIARRTIALLEPYEAVVVPSGSCTGTIRCHYPELLATDPGWLSRAEALAARTFEILTYLDDVLGWRPAAALDASVAYHDSCSGLRELGIKEQPRRLLSAVAGLRQMPLSGAETCCGFGGTFCVKYPSISNAIVEEKAAAVEASGADLLLSGDLGCLMNMAGKLHRRGAPTRVFHTIEVLAGMADGPAIGEEP
ncbi:(Fe-S)-binding protein [Sphingomonas desiccabilis]|uniref:(Fe-S)-binding protein n=1 Tax=Sphingomonas desiccabilis TaxID=429134 RepID=A0A4Q2IPH3_9SPHN|nr:(Fe-S)-binding protein [Sphingomonas desiccabilis]MBB3912663.1 L-lactate dehydrogenase complex protein LldE [Sphingomonas desiccabilis]RXZ29945.1 (Fe-S)-binding protein [Sphingomonas desiccabilis]